MHANKTVMIGVGSFGLTALLPTGMPGGVRAGSDHSLTRVGRGMALRGPEPFVAESVAVFHPFFTDTGAP